MLIYDHAVDNFLNRILNKDPDVVGDSVREYARDEIKKTYYNPEQIKCIKDDMPPIWIRGQVAAVVATDKKVVGDNTIYKYDPDKGENSIIIPTIYNVDTFSEKNDINELDESKIKKGSS